MLTYDTALATRPAYHSLIVNVYQRKCAWCGEPITGRDFEAHHWLIKRSGAPKSAYALLNVVINVVPLHQKCHSNYGQSMAMQQKCFDFVSTLFSAQIINDWAAHYNKE